MYSLAPSYIAPRPGHISICGRAQERQLGDFLISYRNRLVVDSSDALPNQAQPGIRSYLTVSLAKCQPVPTYLPAVLPCLICAPLEFDWDVV